MRVGIVTGGGIDTGGVFQVEMAILHALRDQSSTSDHSFVVFSYGPMPYQEILQKGSLSFVTLPPLKGWQRVMRKAGMVAHRASYPHWIHKVRTRLQKSMEAHGIRIAYFPYLRDDCLALDIPFILNVWDLQHRLQPMFPEVSVGGIWERRERFYSVALPRAARIIAESESGKQDIVRFYRVPEERIVVLPLLPAPFAARHATDSESQNMSEQMRLPSEYLFYPAQFWPHKNHAGLLHALKLLKEKFGITMPAVFVGSDKGNLSYIKRLAIELGLDSQTHFLGLVPDEAMPVLYQRAFALVIPTYFGPTNIPPLEAFALGCPVIISDVSGIREQVKDAAVLVDPSDPISICSAIISLYRNSELRTRMIERGYERAKEWNQADYARSFLSIVSDLGPILRCWE